MVDGVLLLVDAAEGPLPQTRFVLRKTLEARLPVVLVVNKVDRSDARVAEVVHEVEELFLDLDADEHQIDFPIVYCNARSGRASLDPDDPELVLAGSGGHRRPQAAARAAARAHPRARVRRRRTRCRRSSPTSTRRRTSAGSRSAASATARCGAGKPVAWCRADGSIETVKITEMYVTEALDRVDANEAGPGEIVAIAGLADVTIGETLADPDDPRPLPVIHIDDPSLSMTVGINTSPLAGQDGTKLTARLVKNRLDAELVGNVSLRVLPTERPDAWEVQGRGELQLAVLVEMMRREGFELTVGKPEVVTREIDGKVHEPVERVAIDVPEEFLGVVTQLLALRKGRLEQMVNHGTGWVRMEYLVRGAWPRRLPHRVHDRDARHRPAAPRVRALRAVARRAAHAPDGQPRRRPPRHHHVALADEPAGAGAAARRPRASRSTRG